MIKLFVTDIKTGNEIQYRILLEVSLLHTSTPLTTTSNTIDNFWYKVTHEKKSQKSKIFMEDFGLEPRTTIFLLD